MSEAWERGVERHCVIRVNILLAWSWENGGVFLVEVKLMGLGMSPMKWYLGAMGRYWLLMESASPQGTRLVLH